MNLALCCATVWATGFGSGVAAAEALAPGDRFRDCAACPEMVVVPTGDFMMGSPDHEAGRAEHEGPRHRVSIRQPFALDTYEVTTAEWRACAAEGACIPRPAGQSGNESAMHPVVGISWNDAKDYAAWLTLTTGFRYRLPSEAEWEHAARAGTETARFWGESAETACEFANLGGLRGCADGHERAAPVGSYRANPFGLHDMLGNVAEWVEDCWYEGYEGAPADGNARSRSLRTSLPEPSAPYPPGDCNWKAYRGGDWTSAPDAARSAARAGLAKGEGRDFLGFRIARSLP